MVSKASEDLPEPDSPVITTSESRGSSTVTSLRLCSRAPVTTMVPERDIRPPPILRRRTDVRASEFSQYAANGSAGGREHAGVGQLRAQVVEERLGAQVVAGDAAQQLARRELAAVAVDVLAQPLR